MYMYVYSCIRICIVVYVDVHMCTCVYMILYMYVTVCSYNHKYIYILRKKQMAGPDFGNGLSILFFAGAGISFLLGVFNVFKPFKTYSIFSFFETIPKHFRVNSSAELLTYFFFFLIQPLNLRK